MLQLYGLKSSLCFSAKPPALLRLSIVAARQVLHSEKRQISGCTRPEFVNHRGPRVPERDGELATSGWCGCTRASQGLRKTAWKKVKGPRTSSFSLFYLVRGGIGPPVAVTHLSRGNSQEVLKSIYYDLWINARSGKYIAYNYPQRDTGKYRSESPTK